MAPAAALAQPVTLQVGYNSWSHAACSGLHHCHSCQGACQLKRSVNSLVTAFVLQYEDLVNRDCDLNAQIGEVRS